MGRGGMKDPRGVGWKWKSAGVFRGFLLGDRLTWLTTREKRPPLIGPPSNGFKVGSRQPQPHETRIVDNPRAFTGFYWIVTGFEWVSFGFTELSLVLLSILGFTGFYRVLPSFTGFYWVLLCFNGFYWVILEDDCERQRSTMRGLQTFFPFFLGCWKLNENPNNLTIQPENGENGLISSDRMRQEIKLKIFFCRVPFWRKKKQKENEARK